MTCEGQITVPATGNGKPSGIRFTVQIQPGAADGKLHTDAEFNLTNGPSGHLSGGMSQLQYRTPTVAAVPTVDPTIGTDVAAPALLTAGGEYLNRRRKNGETAWPRPRRANLSSPRVKPHIVQP
ncbi:hypothetical protein GCM10023063_24270 [Arthrobacter methylotrophus]